MKKMRSKMRRGFRDTLQTEWEGVSVGEWSLPQNAASYWVLDQHFRSYCLFCTSSTKLILTFQSKTYNYATLSKKPCIKALFCKQPVPKVHSKYMHAALLSLSLSLEKMTLSMSKSGSLKFEGFAKEEHN